MSSLLSGISQAVAILKDPNAFSELIEREVEKRSNEVRKKALQTLSLGVFISKMAINNLKSRITALEIELASEREQNQSLTEKVDLLAGQLRSSEEKVEELTRDLAVQEQHLSQISSADIAIQAVPDSVLQSIETQTIDSLDQDKELSLIQILSEAFNLSVSIVRFMLSKVPVINRFY